MNPPQKQNYYYEKSNNERKRTTEKRQIDAPSHHPSLTKMKKKKKLLMIALQSEIRKIMFDVYRSLAFLFSALSNQLSPLSLSLTWSFIVLLGRFLSS